MKIFNFWAFPVESGNLPTTRSFNAGTGSTGTILLQGFCAGKLGVIYSPLLQLRATSAL